MVEAGKRSVEGFFEGRPEAFQCFEALRKAVEALGPVKMEVMKTQVSFQATRKFAWVWLPQMWVKKRPQTSITLTFCLDRQVIHPRIVEAVEPGPGKWMHHVLVEGAEEIDDEVRTWLKEAYDFGSGPGPRRKVEPQAPESGP